MKTYHSGSLPSVRSLHKDVVTHKLKVKVKSLSHVRLFATPWIVPTRLLRPWDFPGKSTGVGCYFLLQGIFLAQGLNPGLPHCWQMLYHLSHQGIPQEFPQEYNVSTVFGFPSVGFFVYILSNIT